MAAAPQLAYRAPGPVGAAFMASAERVRSIMGPVGSGKTSLCLVDHVYKAQLSEPQPGVDRDGLRWRHYKLVVIRDTYRQLEKTTIPSFLNWFPKAALEDTGGGFTGGTGGRPAVATLNFDPWDGAGLKMIVEFVGVDDADIEAVLGKGYETTSGYLNEADLLSKEVFKWLRKRIGRYPRKQLDGSGGPSWWGITADFNAPEEDMWVIPQLMESTKPGVRFFRQPGGLDPGAENLRFLPGGRAYYEEMVAAEDADDWLNRRLVHNLVGYRRDGKPVYPQFNPLRHVAPQPLKPVSGLPIEIGVDAGGTPAAVVKQRMPDGQHRILDELVTDIGAGMGANRFGELINKLLGEERYRAAIAGFEARIGGARLARPVLGYGDPSAMYGADKEAGEKAWLEILASKTEIRFKPAPSNELGLRQEAVREPLRRTIDGTAPALLVSPSCKFLIKGFASKYRYRKLQVSGDERYDDKPEKNHWSHVHDALQYVMLGGDEYLEVTGRREKRERAAAMAAAAPPAAYDPLGW